MEDVLSSTQVFKKVFKKVNEWETFKKTKLKVKWFSYKGCNVLDHKCYLILIDEHFTECYTLTHSKYVSQTKFNVLSKQNAKSSPHNTNLFSQNMLSLLHNNATAHTQYKHWWRYQLGLESYQLLTSYNNVCSGFGFSSGKQTHFIKPFSTSYHIRLSWY